MWTPLGENVKNNCDIKSVSVFRQQTRHLGVITVDNFGVFWNRGAGEP